MHAWKGLRAKKGFSLNFYFILELDANSKRVWIQYDKMALLCSMPNVPFSLLLLSLLLFYEALDEILASLLACGIRFRMKTGIVE